MALDDRFDVRLHDFMIALLLKPRNVRAVMRNMPRAQRRAVRDAIKDLHDSVLVNKALAVGRALLYEKITTEIQRVG